MKVNSKVNEDSEDDWEVAICQNLVNLFYILLGQKQETL